LDSYDFRLVKKLCLFKHLPEDILDRLLRNRQLRIVEYRKNQIVHSEGDACKNVEIVLQGKLIVEHFSESGDLLVIAKFEPNDLIGGNLVFSLGAQYPLTITSLEPTQLVTVSGDDLFRLLSTYPIMLKTFLQMLSENTLVLNNKITRYLNRTIREGLVTFLRQESIKQNSKKIKLPCSKTHLAEILGVQRTSVSREFKKMENEGLIDFKRDNIILIGIDLEE